MKRLAFCLILTLTSIIILQVCASNKIDSLLTVIKSDKADTSKINHLNDLAWILKYSNPDTSIILSNQALNILINTKNLPEIWKQTAKGKCFHRLATFQYLKGNYAESLDFYYKALVIWDRLEGVTKSSYKSQILSNKSQTLGNIGVVYDEQGDYKKALGYYFKALEIDEKLGNKSRVAAKLANIGLVFKEQAVTLKNAETKTVNRDSLYQISLNYFFKALKINEELRNKNNLAICLGNIGVVFEAQSSYSNALEYYFKALKIDKELGNKNNIATWLRNIGTIYTEQKKFTDAYNCLFNSLVLSNSVGSMNDVKFVYEYLSNLFEKSNIPLPDTIEGHLLNLEQMRIRSLYYFKKSIALHDTLFNIEKQKEVSKIEAIYQGEKKQKEIEILEKDKKLKIAEIKRVQLQNYLFIGGFVLIMLLAILIFRSYKQKQKENLMQLEGKNDKLLIEINEQRQKHLSEVVNIQETERKHIAENLHDELGGALSAIKVNLSSWMYLNQNNGKDNKLVQIESMVDNACTHVRTIAHDLMPPELVRLGFNYAIESLVVNINQTGKLDIHLSNELTEKQLGPEIEIAVYRIVNELLTNTLRHSKAQNASLQLFVSEGILTIIAEDNGIGFDKNAMVTGMGLGNIKSRVAALNGSITMDSAPNKGVSFIIDIPFTGD